MTDFDFADPAEQLAAHYGTTGSVRHVTLGAKVHIVRDGAHRALCGKLVSKVKVGDAWVERDRYTWGAVSCGTCRKAAYKARRAELDRQYGPEETYERVSRRAARQEAL